MKVLPLEFFLATLLMTLVSLTSHRKCPTGALHFQHSCNIIFMMMGVSPTDHSLIYIGVGKHESGRTYQELQLCDTLVSHKRGLYCHIYIYQHEQIYQLQIVLCG